MLQALIFEENMSKKGLATGKITAGQTKIIVNLNNASRLKYGETYSNGHRTIKIIGLDYNEKENRIYARFRGNARLPGYRPVEDLVTDGYR